jgi:NTP pyrophosphatase (non-canonical NTP hydrolase)
MTIVCDDTIQQAANAAHALAHEKGWHKEGLGEHRVPALIANLHGEVSELWEAYRNGTLNKPCDKASKMVEPLTCAEEELADIVIRAFDTAGVLGIDIARAICVKHAFNEKRPYRHGGKKA